MIGGFAMVFVAAVVVAGGFWALRLNAEDYRRSLNEDDRKSLIQKYALLGVVAPWPLCFLLFKFLGAFKPTMDKVAEPGRTTWLLLIGTLCTAAGLPFVAKMLRLIRSDAKAGFVALLMSGYGLILWTAVSALLLMMFMKSCC